METSLETIRTSIETTLFTAYMCGQDNKTITPDRNFKQWLDNNKVIDSVIRICDEFSELKAKEINIEELALEAYPVDNHETSKGCIDDMNLSDRQTWVSGAKKILDFFKKTSTKQTTTPVKLTVTIEEPKQRIVILDDPTNIIVQTVNVMGMPLIRWSFKGCKADFGVGDDFATLYNIVSKDKGKGHASFVLQIAKSYYEKNGKRFGGTVALNDTMSHIYKKLNIHEYGG